jgi:hypothetical protein
MILVIDAFVWAAEYASRWGCEVAIDARPS